MQLQYNTSKKKNVKNILFIFDQIFYWHNAALSFVTLDLMHNMSNNMVLVIVIYLSTFYIFCEDIVFCTMGKKRFQKRQV